MFRTADMRLVALAVFALVGAAMLEGSLTGFVVSQSCCFPTEGVTCLAEYACVVQQPGYSSSIPGALILLLSLTLIGGELWLLRKH